MQLHDLPLNVLVQIFGNIDSIVLASWSNFINNDHDNVIARVIQAVTYSNIIVTNEWYGLLLLQPRALKIETVESLSKNLHVSFDEFFQLMFELESKIDKTIPIPRAVKFILSTENERGGSRYKYIRLMAKIMRQMPKFVQTSVKQIHLKSPPISELLDFDLKLDLIFCTNLVMCDAVIKNVDIFSIEAGVSPHEPYDTNLTSAIEGIECFQSLTSLQLTKMGLIDVSKLSLPKFLKKLNVSCNALSLIDGKFLPRRLQFLDVSSNNLSSIENIDFLKNLEELVLNHNELEELNSLPQSIRNMDISFNRVLISDIRLPNELQALKTDIVQYSLMSDEKKNELYEKQIAILRSSHKVII